MALDCHFTRVPADKIWHTPNVLSNIRAKPSQPLDNFVVIDFKFLENDDRYIDKTEMSVFVNKVTKIEK